MADRYRDEALKQANAVREQLGLSPVDHLYQGDHHASTCTISRTIVDDDYTGGVVTTMPLHIQVWEHAVGLTSTIRNNTWVSKFIDDFDEGKYPDLCLDDHIHVEKDGGITVSKKYPIDSADPPA
jgi:hypothetical protein